MSDYEDEKIIKVPRFERRYGFSTTSERSSLMSKIKGKNTAPEIKLRKALWNIGFRYRLHNKQLPGKPDIVMLKYMLVIFIDGEFWHGFNWEQKRKKIKANRDFWIPKIERNIQRDKINNIKLEAMGFKVLRFWEQEIKNNLENSILTIAEFINGISND